jgi:nucleoside phosphorylase
VDATPDLVSAAQRVLPLATTMAIGTSAWVGGTAVEASAQGGMIPAVQVEAMEGFAVLRAAAIAGTPAIEVRAISNEIEETDRARWQFDTAFDAIIAATPLLVAEFERILGGGDSK